ncbi:MAG TPA: S8 family serine peptidase [Pyrinomonadaceae bacterium]|jgi:serine protease AprX
MTRKLIDVFKRFFALSLILLLSVGPASAGIAVTGADGIAVTGADGISFTNVSGIATTGADGFLTFSANGIATTGADGIATTGADGARYTGTNGIATTGADSMQIARADGIAVTGADGIAVTGADGTTYHANSLVIRNPSGIATTGADGIATTGADGIAVTGADSFTVKRADGITTGKVQGIAVTGADGIAVTGADGTTYNISPNGIAVTGADGIAVTGADGIAVTGADGISTTRLDGIATTGADGIAVTGVDSGVGIKSVDPELALMLDKMTDDSNINAAIVYHRLPTDADIAELQSIGVLGGTRFKVLPVIIATATRRQLVAISRLSSVRSIYGNRTLQSNIAPVSSLTSADRVRTDGELTRRNNGLPFSGRGVTVAVLDTGLDGTHSDFAGRVAQNVKLADSQSAPAGFNYPINTEGLPNTDQAYGHGTFVAGTIAGSGSRSGGRYQGVAPAARLVGLSAGDLSLSFVLTGFDYLLERGQSLGVRVINCSFSANTVFDVNDPVNVATRMLADSGITVVFSAGNTGSGLNTLNPYAVAPWVVSVGATDANRKLADFSSRGAFGSTVFRPTLVAPGVAVVAPRSATSATGALGLATASDMAQLSAGETPYYTTASGTSFSAPQVAGAVALMLEANPRLTPAEIKDILQRTATPLPAYYGHEVGAGMLNTHAAVIEAAFPQRRIGTWRSTLDRGQVRFINDPAQKFTGTVSSGGASDIALNIPENTLVTSIQIAWGPVTSVNDLALTVYDPAGSKRAESNVLNLPGLTGKRERAALNSARAGAWRARVTHTLGATVTPQSFTGVMETTRVEYAPLADLAGLTAAAQAEVNQSLRQFTMLPYGRHFRPQFAVSRADLAAALVMSGRAAQYLPAQSSFTDVRDPVTTLFVESVQAAQGGPFFTDAQAGGAFRPDADVDRLTAAVVLVRAAGLGNEAEARKGEVLALTDAGLIPSSLRGYVAVAIARGLLQANGTLFNPQDDFTRLELAHALAVMTK